MAEKVKAFIMAAGAGSRLYPFTTRRSKTMIPILNKPVLQHGLEELKKAGVRDVRILVGPNKESITGYFSDGSQFGMRIEYAEQKESLGTADAIRYAKGLGERFLAVSGDVLFSHEDITGLMKTFSRAAEAAVSIAEKDDVSPFGKVIFKGAKLVGIREKSERGKGFVNAGIYMLSSRIFDAVDSTEKRENGEYYLTDSVMMLRKSVIYKMRGYWNDIGYPWDILNATEEKIKSIKRRISGKAEKVVMHGSVIIGERTIVRGGTYIEGPVVIGEDCEIGPNAYIRSGTVIGNSCKVGSGCEIKNSVIMDRTKVPHLSYIGDSVIDEDCNLGAGTITANLRFDRKPVKVMVKGELRDSNRIKLGAFIGRGVQTGVNVSINPGVVIAPGSKIMPGETVRRDIA